MSGNSVKQHPSSQPVFDEVRQQHNAAIADLNYERLNQCGSVAPGCTTGAGTGIKVATANNTTYIAGGKPTALAATGNYWDLTKAGQNTTVMVGPATIKYRLMADSGQNAQIQSSTVGANANACAWLAPPANNNAILGMATVSVSAGNNFTPGTTGLAGTGVTTTYQDGSDGSELIASQVTL